MVHNQSIGTITSGHFDVTVAKILFAVSGARVAAKDVVLAVDFLAWACAVVGLIRVQDPDTIRASAETKTTRGDGHELAKFRKSILG